MALDLAASERKRCDSRRGKENNSPILHSVKFLVFGRGCSKKKKRIKMCPIFERLHSSAGKRRTTTEYIY